MGRQKANREQRRRASMSTTRVAPPIPARLPTPTHPAAPRGVSPTLTRSDDPVEQFLDRMAPEVVAATYWFEPPDDAVSQTYTLRVTGRRLNVQGSRVVADDFVRDQSIPDVVRGAGPVAVTIKAPGVNPGEWSLSARIMQRPRYAPADVSPTSPLRPTKIVAAQTGWSWRRWKLSPNVDPVVAMTRAPFVQPPAVLLGSWVAFVAIGIVVALALQTAVITALDLALPNALVVSVFAILAGVIGGKAWFVFLHRREHRREGWSVQGFVAALAVAAVIVLMLRGLPVGMFLDASTAGLLVGMAIGRLGCFFTGCCAGRATDSRWAIWSSNRTVGARRIPTQLMESAVAAAVGAISLYVVLTGGTRGGAVFVGALALYTLFRQAILSGREERRQSSNGAALVGSVAVIALIADVLLVTLT